MCRDFQMHVMRVYLPFGILRAPQLDEEARGPGPELRAATRADRPSSCRGLPSASPPWARGPRPGHISGRPVDQCTDPKLLKDFLRKHRVWRKSPEPGNQGEAPPARSRCWQNEEQTATTEKTSKPRGQRRETTKRSSFRRQVAQFD